jgi:hypothetical protein
MATANDIRQRAWVFTLNNPPGDFCLKDDSIRYAKYALEIGESGTPHIQGYVVFKDSQRFSRLRNLIVKLAGKAPHVEPRRGTHIEARDYVGDR